MLNEVKQRGRAVQRSPRNIAPPPLSNVINLSGVPRGAAASHNPPPFGRGQGLGQSLHNFPKVDDIDGVGAVTGG